MESKRISNSKWTKTYHREYLHFIGNFCATTSNILSKEIIFNKCRKQILKQYWWNETEDEILLFFYLTVSLNFDIYFLARVPMRKCFWFYLKQLFTCLAFKKCRKDCNILLSGTRFCPFTTEIARFPVGFGLKESRRMWGKAN